MGIQHKRKKNVNFQLVVVTRNNEIPEIIREIRSTGKHSREKKKAALIASSGFCLTGVYILPAAFLTLLVIFLKLLKIAQKLRKTAQNRP